MTAAQSPEDTLVNAGETIGATAGKVVATARRTATAIGEHKEKIADVAAHAQIEARKVIRQTKRETKKAAKSAKSSVRKVAASAKRSVKKVARKLKRR